MNYSVVIPCYNHENFIAEAIESALNQTFPPQEIVVIDDGSKDGSLLICQDFARRNPKVRVVAQPNQGAHNAINAGLRLISSDYIAILNSDDVYELNRFETLFRFASDDWDLIGSNIVLINSLSQDLGPSPWLLRGIFAAKIFGENIFTLAYANYYMTTSNFLFKRSLLSQTGYFNDYRYCHDLDFLLRVCERHKIKFVTQKLLRYRFHSTNTIKESLEKVLAETWKVILTNAANRSHRRFIRLVLYFVSLLNRQHKYFCMNSCSKAPSQGQ